MAKAFRFSSPTKALILKDLADGPATHRDLAPQLGLTGDSVLVALKQLRDERKIYIRSWERGRGRPIPVWSLQGEKIRGDTPYPGALPNAVVKARYRKRHHDRCVESQRKWRANLKQREVRA